MTRTKTFAILALLAGGAIATAALAQMGHGGHGGHDMGGPRLLEMFDAIDANADGKLSLEELESHRSAEFAAADANNDGALDADELAARMLARLQEGLADQVQQMLDNQDDDGNGSLSVDEMGQGPGADHFARIDTDNDGAITRAEAEAAMEHRKMRGHGMGEGGEGWGHGWMFGGN